jgi:sugar lactone lactonase YvrE
MSVATGGFAFMGKWGGLGGGDGQFSFPWDVDVASNGDVYVADTENHRIQRFTPDGRFLGKWGSPGSWDGAFSYPGDVTVAPNGDVYVADTQNHRIQRFTPDGRFLGKWGSRGYENGQFYRPWSLAAAPGGDIYVADGRIQRFTPDGRFVLAWSPGFAGAVGVAVAPDGSVYAVGGDVLRYTANGARIYFSHGPIEGGLEVDVAPDGSFYVVGGAEIRRYTPDGRFLGKWGSHGSGDGQFSSPYDVAVAPDRTVYVTDSGNNRVQRFGEVDVYLRDHVGDTGESHAGAVSVSPDIIVRTYPVADPQAAFGQGSGTEANETLSDPVVYGLNNHLYARVLNRGQAPATNTAVSVYWSEVATLVTPNAWKLIGTASLPAIEPGNVLTVSDAITWPASGVPAPGHYCFVGVVGSQVDPAPALGPLSDWEAFVAFIRQQNNVTWRNFNVIQILEAKPVELPFVVPGAPEEDVAMDFELLAEDFPRKGRLALDAPAEFADWEGLRGAELDQERRRVKIPVKDGKLKLKRMKLPAGSRAAVKTLVQPPREALKKDYDLVARQLYEGVEVGRITWRLRRARRGESSESS